MSDSDIITLPKIVTSLPSIITALPKMAKGMWLTARQKSDQPTGVGYALELATKKYPDNIAVAYRDVKLTYAEFNAWSNRIANTLLQQGIGKGDVIALFMENRPEFLAVCSAGAKIGAVTALINTAQKGDILLHSFALVKPKLTIVGEERLEVFAAIKDQAAVDAQRLFYVADRNTYADPGKEPAGYHNLMSICLKHSPYNPATTNNQRIDDPCFNIFTSGTTGLPKASIVSHGRWMKAYSAFGMAALRLTHKDTFYITLPLYHATALVCCWSSVLSGGATVAIGRKFSATEFWNDVRFHRATVIGYIGEICRYLLNQPVTPLDQQHAVKKMFGNGLRPAIWTEFKERFGIDHVVEIYGSSEGNIGFTNIFNFDNTVGYSPANWTLVKYDKETEQPLKGADGFLQQVEKHGVGLLISAIDETFPFDGYTSKEKSELATLRNVFTPGDAWFNTGDLMRDLGYKHAQFVDRMGDTFRWKGENVSTTEVEHVVNKLNGIDECVAYGVEIPHTNGRAGMIGITLQVDPEDINFAKFYRELSQSLPPYAVPRFIRIMESIVITGTFKYKKNHLKEEAFDPIKIKEPLFVLLPDTETYTELTGEIYDQICAGLFRF